MSHLQFWEIVGRHFAKLMFVAGLVALGIHLYPALPFPQWIWWGVFYFILYFSFYYACKNESQEKLKFRSLLQKEYKADVEQKSSKAPHAIFKSVQQELKWYLESFEG